MQSPVTRPLVRSTLGCLTLAAALTLGCDRDPTNDAKGPGTITGSQATSGGKSTQSPSQAPGTGTGTTSGNTPAGNGIGGTGGTGGKGGTGGGGLDSTSPGTGGSNGTSPGGGR